MSQKPDASPDNDHEIRRRVCADVLGGQERWHTESGRRRAKRYFFESTGKIEADESEIGGFLQWYTHDFRDAATGRTLMEHHYETHGAQLTPREREMLEALRDSWPGVFEAETIEEGRGLHLRDLATGDLIFVHDVTASREMVRVDCILTRIEKLDGKLMFASDGFSVPPAVKDEFLTLIDKEAGASGQTRAEYVRRSGNLLYRKIKHLSDRWIKNLQIVNREGDALEFCHADYSVLDEPALLARLRTLEELLEEPEEAGPALRLRPRADGRRPPAPGSAIPHAPATGPGTARSQCRTIPEAPGRCVAVPRRNQAAGGGFERTTRE